MSENCIFPTVKHRSGAVMLWGYFRGENAGDIVQIKDIMQQEEYHSILQRHAIPGSCITSLNFVLQQDNDLKHSFKCVQII